MISICGQNNGSKLRVVLAVTMWECDGYYHLLRHVPLITIDGYTNYRPVDELRADRFSWMSSINLDFWPNHLGFMFAPSSASPKFLSTLMNTNRILPKYLPYSHLCCS